MGEEGLDPGIVSASDQDDFCGLCKQQCRQGDIAFCRPAAESVVGEEVAGSCRGEEDAGPR